MTQEARRADAQRNREALVAVAREVMAEEGIDVSLRSVARRAGVGIGTLYRHFPNREALVLAVLAGRLNDLAASAEAVDDQMPAERLVEWLKRLAGGVRTYQGLATSVLESVGDEDSEWHLACLRLRTSLDSLLNGAQATGKIRADVSATDLFAAAASIGWMSEMSSPASADRVLAVLIDGLRAQDPG